MKKLSFILLLSFIGIYMNAQEHLLPVDKKAKETFYDKEIKRLLIPDDTEFGMICKPSFEFESSLTYDSEAHALIYIEADTSIWSRTYQASHRLERISEREFMWKSQQTTSYHAPGTKMYILPISDEMAQSLKRLWKVAINQAEFPEKVRTKMKTEDGKVITVEIEEIVLDGTGWEYFFKGKRANFQGGNKGGKGKVGSLINLTIELRNAVRENDSQKCAALQSQIDSLYKEFK
ncbi:MAG: hypothetical protein IKY31_02380 [Bacteroidaceae bacterium]|nr:hypothetical protein [Bacteroidaceae bacterium]